MKHQIQKTALKFALKNKISLGRRHDGYYTILGEDFLLSLYPTAKSAITMMRKYLHRNEKMS